MRTHVLAVDVGGTKLAAGVVDAGRAIVSRAEVPTPVSDDPAAVTAALVDVARRVADPVRDIAALGIGSAGPVDPIAGTVSPVNIPAWHEFPILAALEEVVPGRPAVLAGDGHCMALGEHRLGGYGAAMLGIVVSTGVGGGLVVDGRAYLGASGNAGHIGHTVVDVNGPPCGCGGHGCVEAFASGPAMVRWASAHGWSPASGAADARALACDARSGHAIAGRAFRRAAGALAAGIVSAAALVDLDDVVVGGGVARAGDLLLAPLRSAVSERAGLPFVRRVRIHASRLGRDAGLIGAAALALDALATRDRHAGDDRHEYDRPDGRASRRGTRAEPEPSSAGVRRSA